MLLPHISTLFPYTTLFRSTLVHFGISAILGMLFAIIYRGVFDMPSSWFFPLLYGFIFGIVIWFLSSRVLAGRSEEHTSELQSLAYLVCRLLLEKKNVGDALHSLVDLGTGALRLDANGFLGVEKSAEEQPGWSEVHPLSGAANQLIGSMIRKAVW